MTTNHVLLVIPTIKPLTLWQRCVSSFHTSLIKTRALALVVYNGLDAAVQSDYSHPNVVKIGFCDSAQLSHKFAEIANCPEELLFGKQEYGRSYGGASNLLLALGHALGASVIGKIDDDCSESGTGPNSWLRKALQFVRPRTVCFGPYSGQSSGFLHTLPEQTAFEFVEYIYSKKARSELCNLGTGKQGRSIKNGNLVFTKDIPCIASYPVLYEPITKTHARGEVYYWSDQLRGHDCTFKYQHTLNILHDPSNRNNTNSWLCSLVLAFDLSHVHRILLRGKKQPLISERQKAISQFKSWILKANWPAGVNAEELATLLCENSLEFTQRFYSDLPKRTLAWSRLMNANLGAIVEQVLPALWVKSLEVFAGIGEN